MRLQAVVRVLPDVGFVALGLLALVDGARAFGLLRPAAVVFTLGWVGALLVRRRVAWSPALVPLIIAAHGVALRSWPNESVGTVLALVVSAGLFGARMPVRRALEGALLWPGAVGVLLLATSYGESGLSDLIYPSLYLLSVLGGGMVVGRATTGRAAARARAEYAEREFDARRAGIVLAERARIARDLRALVAAEIHGIRRRVNHTRSLLDRGDLAEAERALLEIEDAGRETLADLRHMLGLLRRDMTGDALRPQPGIGMLGAVVAGAGERGTTVHLKVEGSSDGLPRGIEVVVYRVVERTVEHACRAGVPQLSVQIRHSPEAVGVQICGLGIGRLVGEDHLAIRERVVVFGGDLLMGTDERDRDVLEVRLPLPAAAEATPA